MYVCRECFVPATADDKQMITRNILQLSDYRDSSELINESWETIFINI